MFSKLEVARTNEIFGQIEHVLLENNYDIRGKYITVGKCRWPTITHNIVL
jgi:hypothetical protein